MKIKYKNIEGELIPCHEGYVVIQSDGGITYPDFIFVGQDDQENIHCYGAIIVDDNVENVLLLDDDDILKQTITQYDLERYLKYETILNGGADEKELEFYANNILKIAEFRKVYVFEPAKRYVKNKLYINILKVNKNEKNRN